MPTLLAPAPKILNLIVPALVTDELLDFVVCYSAIVLYSTGARAGLRLVIESCLAIPGCARSCI